MRLAISVLRRQPSFAVTAVTVLGVGIAAVAVSFSILDMALWRPLPWPAGDRVVVPEGSVTWTVQNYHELAKGSAFDRVEAVRPGGAVAVGTSTPAQVETMAITGGFFSMLGLLPQHGRLIAPADVQRATAVAVLRSRTWRMLFESEMFRPGMLLAVGGSTFEVVGVLADDAAVPTYGDADVWIPLAGPIDAVNLLMRLAPGTEMSEAEAQVRAVVSGLTGKADSQKPRLALRTLRELTGLRIRHPARVALAAAVLILLLAASNVANLQLLRIAGRGHEFAIRVALGATHWRIRREVFAEAAVISVVSGILGMLLASSLASLVERAAPPWLGLSSITIDGRVAAVALGGTVLVFALTGLLSVAGMQRISGTERDHGAYATHTIQAKRLREALVGVQAALVVVVLSGMALLVRTYAELYPRDPGFETSERVVASAVVGPEANSWKDPADFASRVAAGLATLPGITDVTFASYLPMSGIVGTAQVLEQLGSTTSRQVMVNLVAASPLFLTKMRRVILAGRDLEPSDRFGSQAGIVVNESAARRLGRDARAILGEDLALASGRDTIKGIVVGTVADGRSYGFTTVTAPEIYVSFLQFPTPRVEFVMHRSRRAAISEADIRQVVALVDDNVPVTAVQSFEEMILSSIAVQRFQMLLLTGMSVVALPLAWLGCYGVQSREMQERLRDMAIRAALGASPSTLIRAISMDLARVVGVGLAAGTLAAWWTAKFAEHLVYGIAARDPLTLLGTSAVSGIVLILALVIPGMRIRRVKLATTLRGLLR